MEPGAWLQCQVVDLRGLHASRAAHLHGQRTPAYNHHQALHEFVAPACLAALP